MDSSSKAAVSAAVASGYLLGRTKKAKYAFALATYVAGRRFSLSPSKLAHEGLRHLKEHPHLAELRDKVSGELLTAARSAVTGSADRRFAAMAEALRERNSAGRAGGDQDQDAEDAEPADDAAAEGEELLAIRDEEDDQEDDEEDDEDGATEDEYEEDDEVEEVEDEDEPEAEPAKDEQPEAEHRQRARHTPGRSRSERSARRRAPHGAGSAAEGGDGGTEKPAAKKALGRKPAAARKPAPDQPAAKKSSSPRKAAAKQSPPAGKKAAQKRSPAQRTSPGSSPSQSNRRGR
ncbi:hypothetical protein GA0115240_126216 [Streptomyces sp. DvalAA-14]|uniref:hypothetical protein n=1 Tax=unclassified Streptomyces TaxID=2593676 RepID=UPI00081B7CED|nr:MULTISPECIES: hypothetical protein [unclassified Streptomyces]MYS21149.1 histone protein [Streptomyces sp. SID4948]SCD85379.1 hypothetical protein GA0115240_126216 [Streptomyces sp. DvalAA-14]